MGKALYVVSRQHPQLYEYLKNHAARDPDAEVIYDRRLGERRRASRENAVERRARERRQHAVERSLAEFGWALVTR